MALGLREGGGEGDRGRETDDYRKSMPFSVRLAQNLYRWGYWGPPGCLLVRVRSQVPPVRAKWITVTQERERVSFEKLHGC